MVICVGIPCFDGRPHAQTVDSLLAEQFLCSQEGVHLLVTWSLGIPYVSIARNLLARTFLKMEGVDTMVMIDADMSWGPGALLSLAKRPEDVIGGTYRPKEPTVRFHIDSTEMQPEKHGDLWKVGGLPGGFIKITRKALLSIDAPAYLDREGEAVSDYFPTGWLGERYRQEDYGFCWLYRQNGGDVWLDPSLKLRHHDGMRATYDGDVTAWMEATYDH